MLGFGAGEGGGGEGRALLPSRRVQSELLFRRPREGFSRLPV
jgi:hypothetical protein